MNVICMYWTIAMSHESDQDRSRHAAGTFIDCTKWLADTSPDLGIGSVVRSSSLTLFDAMIAIEVFADRMDSGLVTLPDLRTPPHDDAFLMKLAHFSPEQVSSTLVLLFRAFSTYVSGAGTLSNTIFTSVFVRNAPAVPRQDQLGPEVLRIFVFCLIRCSFYFVNLFSCLGLYEEEDFSLEQASLDLLGGLDDDTLLDKLGTLIRRLPDAEQADGIAGAVPLLLFVKNLLILLTRLGSSPHSKLDEAVDCLRQAISTFTVPQSHPTIVHVADCHTDDQSTWDLGFNPRALRHLTIHCPPRNAPWMSLAEALGLWDRISKQSVAVAQLQNGPPLSPVGLLSVIEHATAWEQAPRSFLHLALFTQSGLVNGRPFQHLMEEWLLEVTGAPFAGEPRTIDSLVVSCVRASVQGNVMYRSANVVRSLESEVRGQLAHLCNLLYRAAEPVIRNAFRAFVHNPARTRRLLFKVCQQLASLESSADSIDSEIAILLNLPDLPGFLATGSDI
ncbi:Mak10 subunit, NatC N-terminal acetyltransferase-domain-containing protein [Catenaria anguillulae PL171]|uniref:Mak10 subunit, NatC N-terminal acetyltransferase-domain-containing protein n=1 Tax=Catenaria anguillulae PL171 TaxID=765915 RepID=A0A1Y2H5G0_9FUNG|nr:Mak10 subunit, NatC N-terminal acetyltransferase-domain-containing protein [Catenaria anguillulae PL171]